MQLSPDFRELLECFDRHEVRYLVVGGWALAAHGVPRLTKDLDLWVWPDDGNADAVVRALEEFGFAELGLARDDFISPDVVVQLGYPPNRVDLITTPSGVDFQQCWADRLSLTLDGLEVPFIGLEGLKANKLASGRAQDVVDVQVLDGIEG